MGLERTELLERPAGVHRLNPIPIGLSLRFRISERRLLLFLGDAGLLSGALLVILFWRFDLPLAVDTVVGHPRWFVILIGIWYASAAIFRAYDLGRAANIRQGVAAGVRAAGTTSLVYLSIPFLPPALNESRLTAAAFILTSLILVALWRLTYATVLAHPTFRRRVAIVGVNAAGRALAVMLQTAGRAEYDFLGFITTNGPGASGETVLGQADDLVTMTQRWGLAELILADGPGSAHSPQLVKAVLGCQELGIEITSLNGVYERLAGKVPVEHLDRNFYAVLPLDHSIGPFYAVAKRGMDIVLGSLGVTLTALFYPVIALAHRIEDPGPILYRQVRMGQGGRLFMLLKFRTMRVDAEAAGPRWATINDPRTTKVGRLLRRLHLDELPQSVNIIRGEMSLVGPRPERPEFVAELERRIPFYRARNALRPGVTGWAQVNFRYGSSVDDALVKLQFDLFYLKHMSGWLDLLILWRTVGRVATLRGY